MKRSFCSLLVVTVAMAAALSVGGSPAHAKASAIEVSGARIELGELWPEAPEDYTDIDVGPAPPPGRSRLLTRVSVERQVSRAGFDSKAVKLPKVMRVTSAKKDLSPTELAELAKDRLSSDLKVGITIKSVRASRGIAVPPDAAITEVKMPRPPRRRGAFRTSAVAEFRSEDRIVARVSLSVTLMISEQGALPDVQKGKRLSLVIDRGSASISARGIALSDGDVGDTLSFRIAKTGKVLRAQVTSAHRATVLGAD